MYYASIPYLVRGPDGGLCIAVRRQAFDDPASVASADAAQEPRWLRLVARYPMCARVPAPATSPTAMAAEYWRVAGEDLLPAPRPRIAPGYMLAGKLAYMEANTDSAGHYEHPTPLGTLVIDATSTVFVDWGDASGWDGPHQGPGRPWPNGTITHYWTDQGRYDIVVQQRWSATWTLGSAGGSLFGLATEGRLDDFEVRQLQAVINR